MKKILLIISVLWASAAICQDLPYKALGEGAKRIPINDYQTELADSLKLATSRAIQGDLANVYDTRGRFLNVWKKLLTGATISGNSTTRGKVRLRVAGFGDSVGGYVFTPFTNLLTQMLGFGGGIYGSVATTGGGSIHSNNDETTYWFNGNWYEINGSGSLTFTYGGGRMSSTLLKVYYIKEPGAGTFQVQVDAGAGYVNEGSVVDANATLAGGVISIPKSQGAYSIRINQVSGNVKIIMCAGINEPTDYDAVTIFQMNVGGLDWEEANATDKAITSPIFADMGIDLATVMFKEGVNIYSLFGDWSTAFQTASPNTDWVLIGSSPQQTSNDVNLIVNASLRKLAVERNWFYFDAYKMFLNYDTLVAKGWQGDGLHPAAATGFYAAAQLTRIIGMDNGILLGRNSGTDPTGDEIFQMGRGIKLLSTANDNAFSGRLAASTSSTDINLDLRRNINFRTAAGTTLGHIDAGVTYVVDGTNPGTLQQRGYTFAIANSPGFYTKNDSTGIFYRNRTGGVRWHIEANNLYLTGKLYGQAFSNYSSGGYTLLARNNTDYSLELVTGTNVADTNIYSTKAYRQKGIDSLAALTPSGTYSPTLTGTANVATVTAEHISYSRNRDRVTVTGTLNITATAPALSTSFTMTLPISSAFTNSNDLGGLANWGSGMSAGGVVTGNSVDDVASFSFIPINNTPTIIGFTFSYVIK